MLMMELACLFDWSDADDIDVFDEGIDNVMWWLQWSVMMMM